MDGNSIHLSGVAISDFQVKSEKFGVFRMKSTPHRDRERPVYIDVLVFGQLFENCSEYIRRGTQVSVNGELRLREWQTQEGSKRNDYSISASVINFSNPRIGSTQ